MLANVRSNCQGFSISEKRANVPKYEKRRIFTLNDPYALRINNGLAKEIGFNESVVLLQLEYLIAISNNWRDGRYWTYQSLNDLHDNYFPWWSRETINRTIKKLLRMKLIVIGNYNNHKYDRTRWFGLNYANCDALESLTVPDAVDPG